MSRSFKLERWESKASSCLKEKKEITNKVKSYGVAREDMQEKSRNQAYLKLWQKIQASIFAYEFQTHPPAVVIKIAHHVLLAAF